MLIFGCSYGLRLNVELVAFDNKTSDPWRGVTVRVWLVPLVSLASVPLVPRPESHIVILGCVSLGFKFYRRLQKLAHLGVLSWN